MWSLDNTLLNNQWILEEIFKTWRQMKTKTIHNLWDRVKAIPIGKFTATQVYLTKQEKSQIILPYT